MGGSGSKIITDYYFKDLNMQRHRGLQSGQGHLISWWDGMVRLKAERGRVDEDFELPMTSTLLFHPPSAFTGPVVSRCQPNLHRNKKIF